MSALQVVPVGELVRERRSQRLARFGWVAGAAILMLAVAVQPCTQQLFTPKMPRTPPKYVGEGAFCVTMTVS